MSHSLHQPHQPGPKRKHISRSPHGALQQQPLPITDVYLRAGKLPPTGSKEYHLYPEKNK